MCLDGGLRPPVYRLSTFLLNKKERQTVLHWDALRYFKRSEFTNPDAMSEELLLKLDWARHAAGIPFHLTSTFRARDNRTHGKGLAVDIACELSTHRLTILRALLSVGFDRIGIYEKHIHVDVSVGKPCLWYGTYPKPLNKAKPWRNLRWQEDAE